MSDFIELLKTLQSSAKKFNTDELNEKSKKKLRETVDDLIAELNEINKRLDPVQSPDYVLDPSSPEEIGKFIATAILERPKVPLALVPKFYGSGIYAIYYHGAFKAYQPIATLDHPIYVGKADPESGSASTPIQQGIKLSARLGEHLTSIKRASSTLNAEDFSCRYLVVKSSWQAAAEKILINLYKPIWNNETKLCFGIGKHGDSSSTRDNKRSPWDTVHPGRQWASHDKVKPNAYSVAEIEEKILQHFTDNPPIQTLGEAFKKAWAFKTS